MEQKFKLNDIVGVNYCFLVESDILESDKKFLWDFNSKVTDLYYDENYCVQINNKFIIPSKYLYLVYRAPEYNSAIITYERPIVHRPPNRPNQFNSAKNP